MSRAACRVQDQGDPGDRQHQRQPGDEVLAGHRRTGRYRVAEGVVQEIAGKACREIAGVHSMGTSGARAFGSIRERIPGSSGPSFAQGVGVEVGEAAIDLDIVVEYGVGIAELGRSIQRNVKQAVETRPACTWSKSISPWPTSTCVLIRRPGHRRPLPRGMTLPPGDSMPRPAVIDGVDIDAVAAAVRMWA